MSETPRHLPGFGEPFTMTVQWTPNARPPAADCKAEPCEVCGGCSVCMDFHDYTGRGCTDDNCPRLRHARP